MGKRILSLYVDDEDIALAKAKGINLSALFRAYIGVELNDAYKGNDKDKIISALKGKLTALASELTKKTEECEKLKNKSKPKLLPFPG